MQIGKGDIMDFRFVRALSVAIMGLAVVGCQTTAESYTEWEQISEPESLLHLRPQVGSKDPEIIRITRSGPSRKQESWRWNGGRLFVADLYPGTYFPYSFRTAKELREFSEKWDQLQKYGVEVTEENVKFGTNRMGRYAYAVSDSAAGGTVCFVFSQATRDHSLVHVRGSLTGTGGYATGYHCASKTDTTAPELEDTMTAYLGRLEYRDQ